MSSCRVAYASCVQEESSQCLFGRRTDTTRFPSCGVFGPVSSSFIIIGIGFIIIIYLPRRGLEASTKCRFQGPSSYNFVEKFILSFRLLAAENAVYARKRVRASTPRHSLGMSVMILSQRYSDDRSRIGSETLDHSRVRARPARKYYDPNREIG